MKIYITYYKASGKEYTDGEVEAPDFVQFLWQACIYVRGLNEEHQLPGLIGGTWPSAPMIVTFNDVSQILFGTVPAPSSDSQEAAELERLRQVEEVWQKMAAAFDRVFQDADAILPDFVPLGCSKIDGLIKLAQKYKTIKEAFEKTTDWRVGE